MIHRRLFALLFVVAIAPAALAADAVRSNTPSHPPGTAIASKNALDILR